ncbi:MAG TPA: hypothetical protein VKY90_01395, partial [Candidatus Dormibacteraeota bacterium]|nr:hypothetical protein [Candidatus Dormibacteraeota bacterium]
MSTHSPFTSVNSKQWAPEQGIPPVTASRWFSSGTLPVPARRVGHLILGDAPAPPGRRAAAHRAARAMAALQHDGPQGCPT